MFKDKLENGGSLSQHEMNALSRKFVEMYRVLARAQTKAKWTLGPEIDDVMLIIQRDLISSRDWTKLEEWLKKLAAGEIDVNDYHPIEKRYGGLHGD